MEASSTYRFVRNMAKYMDDYYIDPIAGFVLPAGMGDIITQLLSLPYIYLSIVKIKSVPLTLSIIYNMLLDTMLGLIPFYIGDVADIFMKSYKKNLALIEGYIDDEQEIIKSVDRKALLMAIAILIIIAIIGFLLDLLFRIANSIGSLFS